jgi:hypothetical protein
MQPTYIYFLFLLASLILSASRAYMPMVFDSYNTSSFCLFIHIQLPSDHLLKTYHALSSL